jgi:hypothetical protein
MKTSIHVSACAAAAALLATACGLAAADSALPTVHREGRVAYLSGGIGQDESKAIQRAERQWPLTLEFAVKDRQRADFAADVDVVVRDARGHAALRAQGAGPFLLARLEPGSYAVAATLDGRTLHEKVVVKPGEPARAVFVWPTGTDGVHPHA